MPLTNKQLIEKADLALADLATAGKLNPEQTNRFVRKLIESPTIIRRCRTVAMTSPDMNINKIGFGSRILKPATSATALSSGDRSKPDLGKVQLASKEVMAEVWIPYEVIEDNIEQAGTGGAADVSPGGIHQTIVDLIAERAALDLEELLIQGDTASGDTYLAVMNGFLKLSTSNVVAVGAAWSKDAVKAGVKAMPDRFLRNRAAMVHWVAVDNETELRDQFGNRQTAMGDAQVQGNLPLYVFGSQVQGASKMPAANGLFTDPMNLIFGIQRNIQIEYDKDIRTRVFVIVLTCRVACNIEEEPAVVKYTTIS
jgi:HK97 family phage major capsid protein